MKMKCWIKCSFWALHKWNDAPDSQSYLRVPHRHVFHVVVKWDMNEDRGIEFIKAKEDVQRYIDCGWAGMDLGQISCENMAASLLELFNACYVSVSEDGENGSEVEVS